MPLRARAPRRIDCVVQERVQSEHLCWRGVLNSFTGGFAREGLISQILQPLLHARYLYLCGVNQGAAAGRGRDGIGHLFLCVWPRAGRSEFV